MIRLRQKSFSSFLSRLLPLLALIYIIQYLMTRRDPLVVETSTGLVKGFKQKTFFYGTEYISFKAIPYAEPPIDDLRFKAPVQKLPWNGLLETSDTNSPSCLSSIHYLNTTNSEDCLFLNVYKPVKIAKGKKLCVMIYIHGGAFCEGQGSDLGYGPDHLMEEGLDVILVTINYRLGPFGFLNLDIPECNGNFGLKDQQLALKWVHENIERFDGDKDCVTIFGQSAGAASVNYHLLSLESQKYFHRAIAMSGSALAYFALSEERNHQNLLYRTFGKELNNSNDPKEMLKFMKQAEAKDILKLPSFGELYKGSFSVIFAPVIETKNTKNAFITKQPREIYANSNSDKDVMFGHTTAEFVTLISPKEVYDRIDELSKECYIDVPVHYISNSSKSSKQYRNMQKKICEFHFGKAKINKTEHYFRQYIRMMSIMNFVHPIYEALKLHAANSKGATFYYQFNVRGLFGFETPKPVVNGTGHGGDLLLLFHARAMQTVYEGVKDSENKQALMAAFRFIPEFFAEFAKTGKVKDFKPVTEKEINCIGINNNGFEMIPDPEKESKQFWSRIIEEATKFVISSDKN